MAKVLERKGIIATLALIDRGIPSTAERIWRWVVTPLVTGQLLKIYKQLVPSDQIDEPGLKRFLYNNNKILNVYRQKGKLAGRIFVFESDENNQNMVRWNAFTNAGLTHTFITGHHLEALSNENTDRIAATITKAFENHNN